MNVSVIGLGKLGLCTAACIALGENRVYGVDSSESIIASLKKGRCPIQENGLPKLLDKTRRNLEFGSVIKDAALKTDASLIIVPTPSGPDGRFINDYIIRVLESLAPAIKEKPGFHIVDIVSTVMPGSCEGVFKPLLEGLTGKICGRDFGLVYNPEFIALGSVIKNFLNPDMVLIGSSDERSAEYISALYNSFCAGSPKICPMSLVNAEITKLSLNCYVTMKVSFANGLAAICGNVPGADVDEVTSAIGADTRVGGKYLTAGTGFAGPCFPRDNVAFQRFAEEYGAKAWLGERVVKINDGIVDWLYNTVVENTDIGGKIAIFGLSYKEGTHIVEESQAVALAARLSENGGYNVFVHDPRAMEEAKKILGGKVFYAANISDALSEAGTIAVVTRWPEYEGLCREIAQTRERRVTLIDMWRIYKGRAFPETVKYISFGLSPR